MQEEDWILFPVCRSGRQGCKANANLAAFDWTTVSGTV
jgi:hypothetical protein